MKEPKLLQELTLELEQKLTERGQSSNVIAQYHYIFSVFIAYAQSFGEKYFSREILERCLREHYGITEQIVLSRRQHYKKKVIRAYQMLCDAALGNPFVDRYLGPKSMLIIDEHNRVIESFCEHLSEIGRSKKTINRYQYYVMRFLDHVEKQGVVQLPDLSVELLHIYTVTMSDHNKCTVKSALGPVRIFLKFLYVKDFLEVSVRK